jgi:hypothetical protein
VSIHTKTSHEKHVILPPILRQQNCTPWAPQDSAMSWSGLLAVVRLFTDRHLSQPLGIMSLQRLMSIRLADFQHWTAYCTLDC